MTGVREQFAIKRIIAVWLLAAVLLSMRLASRLWVWFVLFLSLYGLLGFQFAGRFVPAAIIAVGLAGSVCLHMSLYRKLTSGDEHGRLS